MDFTLREWRITDLDSLVKHANNYNIAKCLTDVFPHPYSGADGKRYLDFVIQDTPPIKIFAIDVDGEAVGSIGLTFKEDVYRKNVEIGYWLSEEYWGKGIVTEAVKQVTQYAFDTFDVNRVYAGVFAFNTGSQKVLEKAGYTLEAELKKTIFKYGEYIDEKIYARRRD